MELLELQLAWQSWSDQDIQNYRVDETVISQSLTKQSQSEIALIKRAMRIKFFVGGLAALTAIGLSLFSWIKPVELDFSPVEASALFAVLALSIMIMLSFNYRAFLGLQKVQASSLDLKSSLSQVIRLIRNVMNINVYSDALMTPVLVVWITYANISTRGEFLWNKHGWILAGLALGLFCFSYFFQRYTQQLKFGRYVDRLQSYLDTLEKEK